MADPATQDESDPFAQLIARSRKDPAAATLASAPRQPEQPADPFAALIAQSRKEQAPETSTFGSLATHAATEAVPAVGGLAGAAAGAELGAGLGAFGGPFAPVTVPVGGLLGGLGGFIVGAHYTAKAQDYALKQVAPGFRDALAETQAKQEKEHPYASFIGGLIPYVPTLSFGGAAAKALPEGATTLQRLAAYAPTKRAFISGGIMGGLEAGNEYLSDEGVSWPKVAIATGFGLVFNKPSRFGEAITSFVGRPVMGARAVVLSPEREALIRRGGRAPTIADALDTKTVGTEGEYHGSEATSPEKEEADRNIKRAELALFTPDPNPVLHATVERMHPELMREWDSLHDTERQLRDWIKESPQSRAKTDYDAIEARIQELSPQVQDAYQRASQSAPHAQQFRSMAEMLAAQGEKPPQAGAIPQPEPVQNVSRETLDNLADLPGQAQRIAADAERRILAVGEPPERARALALEIAENFVTDAQIFRGATGSAEALYAKQGPEWAAGRAKGGTGAPSAPAPPAGAPAPSRGLLPEIAAKAMEDFQRFGVGTAQVRDRIEAIRQNFGDEQAKLFEAEYQRLVNQAVEARKAAKSQAEPAPASHSAAAQTGNPAVDAVVNDPVVKARIDNPTIENSKEVPYGAGASAKPDDPTTHLDKSIPRQVTISGVTFDPAVPANIHEQVERAVMEREIARLKAEHGREPNKAEMDKIWDHAHHEFAEPAENAWVRSQGIDVHEYNIQWIKWLRKTETEDTADASPDLYRKPYGVTTEGRLHGDKDIAALSDEEAAKKLFAERPPGGAPETEEPPLPVVEIKPKTTRRGAAAKPEETWSLLQFLAAKGGIRSDEKLISDLRQSIGRDNLFVPSFGTLIQPPRQISEAARRGGRFAPKTLDAARETAAEAGYLPMDSTPADLLDLIDRELRGSRVYREGYLPPERQMDPVERELHEDRFIESLQDKVKANGGELTETEAARAREIWLREGVSDPDEIIERIFLESKDDADRAGTYEPVYVPGWDDAAHAAGTPRPGDVLQQTAGREGAAGEPVGPPSGEDAGADIEFFQRQRRRGPRNLIEEREAEGQLPLPGAERIGQGELAQRKAEEPLKPTVEQKSMDIGLFGDEAKQRELFQSREQSWYYSAVARAVDDLKMTKASAEQWLNTIRNRPGVKPEELDWLGLEDWLKEQKGAVSKEQVQEYIRENQIEVREVEKGATAQRFKDLDSMSNAVHGVPYEQLSYRQKSDLQSKFWNQEGAPTKFGPNEHPGLTLPGGENYRELLLTLPTKERLPAFEEINRKLMAKYGSLSEAFARWTPEEQAEFDRIHGQEAATPSSPDNLYRSSHFDEPNILAHVRFNDRVIDGKKTLFVEEIQSDWHQQGRKQGYAPDIAADKTELERLKQEIEQEYESRIRFRAADDKAGEEAATARILSIGDKMNALHGRIYDAERGTFVPDAPFKTTWPELSLKRMLRYAADNGYERLAWTSGETQAARNNLSKQISRIVLHDNSSGGVGKPYMEGEFTFGRLMAFDHGNRKVIETGVGPEELSDAIGKETAEKLLAAKPTASAYGGIGVRERKLEGLDLKVGGEGMKGFYDQILPATANKLVKKYGSRVQEGRLPFEGEKGEYFIDPSDDGFFLYGRVTPEGQSTEWFKTRAEAEAERNRLMKEDKVAQRQGLPVHTLDLTDSLKDAATTQGFPLFQGGQRAAAAKTTFREGQRPLVTLFKSRNPSSALEELLHIWTMKTLQNSQHPLAPDQLKADARTILDHTGMTLDRMLNVTQGDKEAVLAHERVAKWGLQWHREGVAPSPQLETVFQHFAEWLGKIWNSLKSVWEAAGVNPDDMVSPQMREVFERMLAYKPERTVIAAERPQPLSRHDVHEERARQTAPEEAHGKMDQTLAETDSIIQTDQSEAANELARETEALRAERQGAARAEPGNEPPGEAGLRPEPGATLRGTDGAPESVAAGGAARAEPPSELPGGGDIGAAGAGLREPGEPAGVGRGREGLEDSPLAPGRADTFDRPDSLNLGKANNVRVENITSQEQLMRAISESSERIAIERGSADRLTMGEMLDLAEDMAIDPKKVTEDELVRIFGGAKNIAAKVWALRLAVRDSAQMVHEATVRARDTNGDPAMVAAAVEAIARHDMIQGVLSSITTEMGRGLGMGFRNLEGWRKAQNLNQFLKDNTGRTLYQWDNIVRLASELDGTAQVSTFVRDAKKHSFGRMLLEYWINGLISGPTTHITYSIGNAMLSLQKAGPETAVAALAGAVRRKMGREGDTVRLGEIGAQIAAGRQALTPALHAAVESLRTGYTAALPGETKATLLPLQPTGTATIFGSGAIGPEVFNEAARLSDVMGSVFGLMRGIRDSFRAGGAMAESGQPAVAARYSNLGATPDIVFRNLFTLPLGGMARAPSRGVAGIHSFYRVLNYSMNKNAEAYRIAANDARGLTGEAFDRRVTETLQSPTDEQMARWAAGATESALMGKGGEIANKVALLTNATVNLPLLGDTQILKFIDPFVKISGNIIKQTIVERSLFGLLSPEIRADLSGARGTVVQDMATARMLVGSAYALLIGGLAAEGYVSGSGPTDPGEAAVWRLAGNQAHSVRIGDTWYDAHRLGPLGMLMGIAADMYDVAHAAVEGEYLEAAAHLQHAITQNILDESFMRGPSDLIKAVDDPGRYGEAYIRSTLSSFIPYSVGMAQVARMADPYTRQARTVMDAIKQKIPGLSEELLPRRDIWGEELPARHGLAKVTALYAQEISRDPVNIAMLNLGMGVGRVPRSIRNVQLTDEQYDDFARIAGRTAKFRLDVIVNSRDFSAWPNHVRRNVIEQVIKQGRESARGLMMMKYPQILRDATQARMERMTED